VGDYLFIQLNDVRGPHINFYIKPSNSIDKLSRTLIEMCIDLSVVLFDHSYPSQNLCQWWNAQIIFGHMKIGSI